jgi:hypothetical protein
MKRALGLDALSQYAVNRAGEVEELSWSLYDFTAYAAAGQSNLSFFQTPNGSGGKVLEDTNMDLAGQIPKGQNFIVESICVEFFPAEAITDPALTAYADDIKAVAESGALTLSVGSKDYVRQAPLGLFPQQFKQSGYAATGLAASAINYSQNCGTVYSIVPVRLTSNQNFLVTLTWGSVVALPSAVDGRIGVRLNGRLFRNSQ